MKPVSPVIPGLDLPEVKIAEHQEEYETLPAVRLDTGEVVSRWNLTWRERLRVLFAGNVYLWSWPFDQPLQLVLLQTERPHLLVVERHTPPPAGWHDDLSSSENHVEAMQELEDLTLVKEVHRA